LQGANEHKMNTKRSNQSLQLIAGCRDDQLEFMKQIVDVMEARSRQR
jgi:hypothetical protein